jgi:hypothetical protein
MDLNNLLNESNQGYKSLQADAARLASKWSATGLLEGLNNENERSAMAMILENQAKQIVAEANTTPGGAIGTSTQAGPQDAWAGVALPLVRKVFAQIAAQDFVSVQPMNLPSGLVFYLDFRYGTAKSGLQDSLYGNLSDANDKMAIDEDVSGGLYGKGRFGYSINDAEDTSVTVNYKAADSASVGYEDGVNPSLYLNAHVATSELASADLKAVRSFSFKSGSAAAAVTVLTENIRVSGSDIVFPVLASTVTQAAGASSADNKVIFSVQPTDVTRGDFEADGGDGNNEAPSITIPSIDVTLASESIVAKTRKLKAQWTPEFAQDLNAYHSIDAEAELTSMLSEYISMEIDLEILDMLIQDAVTTEKWSAENNKVWTGTAWTADTSDFYNTQGQWFQTLGTKMQKVSNKIHQKTLRGGANFAVVSPTVATVLESIPGFAASTDGDKMDFAMGVQKIGSLANRFKVYKNPYMTENVMLMGYRGSQFLETGAVYAPYVPLMMTPLVYDPDTFTPRKGLMTRYAKKMIRPEFYGKIFISDIATI